MGLERRRYGTYYYRKRREGDRVISEYVAAGDLGETMYKLDRKDREREKKREAKEWAGWEDLDRPFRGLEELTRLLVKSHMLSLGYHQHKGQWRKRRVKKDN